MKIKLTILIIGILSIFVFSWVYINKQESTKMDFVFNENIKDGDLIFRCSDNQNLNSTGFNEFGVLEKSLGNLLFGITKTR
ncbi:hypothetical protein [Formosa sp. L2A11]|uniref:hypothetical protein n=1 Tax=Formosa sp. L2A11 TaxID=2686363 RepID=UPI00131CEC76|nr:hypothetical protein [Formosa sp. L2A11]